MKTIYRKFWDDISSSSKRLRSKQANPIISKPKLISVLAVFLVVTAVNALPSANAASLTSSAKNISLPKRIISLSPAATEDLYAIGAGPQVIAVDQYSNYPTSGLPSLKLDGFNPNAEAIAADKPDLVIIQSTATGAQGVIAALTALKIKYYEEITPNTLNDAYKEISDLGNLTGHSTGANNLISFMKKRISNIISSVKLLKPITFYHELDNTLYSTTSSTFIGQVYKSFGLTNIADAAAKADDGGYPQLQAEYIVKANPDIIFLADGNGFDGHESFSTVSKRPGFSSLSAVKNNHVVVLPPDIPSRWGPRLVDFYAVIAKRIQEYQGQ
jgi:iron complex transport system substrate-binding protein